MYSYCEKCGKPLTLVPNVFNRTVHDRCRETRGYIGHFNLTDWWFSAFSEGERQQVELVFQPLGLQIQAGGAKPNADAGSPLTGARGLHVFCRAGSFLANLADWLDRPESRHLARRVIEKAESIAEDPLEKHDVYQAMIVIMFREREKHPESLERVISACMEHIAIAPEVIREWKARRPRRLPTHRGFEQLAIIREKESELR